MSTCDFYCMNTYIITGRRNFKTLLKENYTVGLNSCYLFNVEHGTEHDIDSAYGVCMHQTFLNFTADEFNSLLVCNIIRFFFNCLWGGQTSYLALVAQARILGSIKIKWESTLNEIGYCENTLEYG